MWFSYTKDNLSRKARDRDLKPGVKLVRYRHPPKKLPTSPLGIYRIAPTGRSPSTSIPSSLHVSHSRPAIPVNIQSPEALAARFLQAHPQAQILPRAPLSAADEAQIRQTEASPGGEDWAMEYTCLWVSIFGLRSRCRRGCVGADVVGFSRAGLWDFLYAVDDGHECFYAG